MKVIVETPFIDAQQYGKRYAIGDIVEFDDARAKSLVARGIAKAVELVDVPTECEAPTESTEDEAPVEAEDTTAETNEPTEDATAAEENEPTAVEAEVEAPNAAPIRKPRMKK